MAMARHVSLRDVNRDRVLTLVRERGLVSRGEIARATGLSRPTVSAIVTELLDAGSLARSGARPGTGRGRPAGLVEAAPEPGVALVVDIGRSHVRALALRSTGHALDERSRSFPARTPAARLVEAAAELLHEVGSGVERSGTDVAGVTIGVPSPVDAAGRPLSSELRDLDVAGALAGVRFCDEQGVRVRNDADLGVVGEAAFGGGVGLDNLVRVTVSHGVGAGVVLGRALYRGGGFAGDIGHVRIASNGRACRCGNVGCLETVASVDALVDALQPAHPDLEIDVAGLLRLAEAGDRGTWTLLYEAGMVVGRTLAQIVAFLSPEAVLIDSLPGVAGQRLFQGVRDAVGRFGSAGTTASLHVAEGELGRRAVALGGAALAFGQLEEIAATDGAVSRGRSGRAAGGGRG